MKKIFHKKTLAIAGLVALVLILLPIAGPTISSRQASLTSPSSQKYPITLSFSPKINLAEAAPPSPATKPTSPLDCVSSLGTCVVYFASYLLNSLIGFFVTLGATFVAGFLQLNGHLYDSPAVQTGFSITLSFANLGFVLAIIIIAIATILRNQNYGIKQLLWKLVVMAILVNFGLVVTRPIVSFSDSISGYFIGQMGGSNAGLVTNITNAFQPQTYTSGQPATSGAGNTNWWALGGSAIGGVTVTGICIAAGVVTAGLASLACVIGGVVGGYFATAGIQTVSSLASGTNFSDLFVQAIIGMISSSIILAMFAFTLMALAILLLVRYVYLTILLILLPLAWLAWVFPGLGKHFEKWWSLFIRWTFFPALSLFFIYLTLLIVVNIGPSDQAGYAQTALGITAGQTSVSTADAKRTGVGMQTLMDIALCGMMMGGLYAANELGIAGADTAMKYAESGGKWVAGKATSVAGRQIQKGGRAAYGGINKRIETRTGRGLTERLQGSRLRPIAALGRGISSIATNEKMVEAAKKSVPKDPEEIRSNLAGSMNKEMQFAHIAKLVEMGELKGNETVNGKNVKEFLDSNGSVIERYGQTKPLVVDANKAMGESTEMRSAKKELDVATKAGTNTAAAMAKLNQVTKDFVEKLSKADVAKMNVNGMFEDNTDASRLLLSNIAQFNPSLLPGMLAKAKGSVGANIRDNIFKKICDDEKVGLGQWQSDPESVARNAEATARLHELGNRLSAVQADLTMNASEKGNAVDKITTEQKDLRKELAKMQDNYIEKKLNEKYHKDTFDKAIGNNVFGLPPIGTTPAAGPASNPTP